MSKRKHAIEAHFQSGLRLHGSGQLPEAEQVYRQILAAVPDHADSLHLLGLIAHQTGHSDQALELIGRAIALNGADPDFHNDIGGIHHSLGPRGWRPPFALPASNRHTRAGEMDMFRVLVVHSDPPDATMAARLTSFPLRRRPSSARVARA